MLNYQSILLSENTIIFLKNSLLFAFDVVVIFLVFATALAFVFASIEFVKRFWRGDL